MGEREDYDEPDRPARPPSLLTLALIGAVVLAVGISVVWFCLSIQIVRDG